MRIYVTRKHGSDQITSNWITMMYSCNEGWQGKNYQEVLSSGVKGSSRRSQTKKLMGAKAWKRIRKKEEYGR